MADYSLTLKLLKILIMDTVLGIRHPTVHCIKLNPPGSIYWEA